MVAWFLYLIIYHKNQPNVVNIPSFVPWIPRGMNHFVFGEHIQTHPPRGARSCLAFRTQRVLEASCWPRLTSGKGKQISHQNCKTYREITKKHRKFPWWICDEVVFARKTLRKHRCDNLFLFSSKSRKESGKIEDILGWDWGLVLKHIEILPDVCVFF